MRVSALLAARRGSERVVEKNTRPFAGSTLLDIKVTQLLRLKGIDEVVVSTDDEEIIERWGGHGCTMHRRPSYLASSAAPMSEVYRHMAGEIDTDVIVYANCTSPLVRDKTVEAVVDKYLALDAPYDSVNTATPVREFLLLDGVPLNYNPNNQPRSQDLPNISTLNFAVNVIRRESMIDRGNVLGSSPWIYCIDQVEGFDIDTPIDFRVAEFLFRSNGGEHYLRGYPR